MQPTVNKLCFAAAWLSLGCGSLNSGVSLEATSVRGVAPGHVRAVVNVGGPQEDVNDLEARNFEVREGGVRLDPAQIGLQVRPLGELKGHQAVLVVDAAKPFGGIEKQALEHALSRLVDRLRFHQTVTLAAYDGSPSIVVVATYAQTQLARPLTSDPGVRRLLGFKPRDGSTSLFTAIVEGNRLLRARLASAGTNIQPVGSLVIVARGPDLAGRADESAARAAIESQRTFLLKVGEWSRDSSLDWVGSEGVRAAASLGTLGTPVDELGHAVDDIFLRSYVLTYCSPARSGQRSVEVVVQVEGEDENWRRASAAGNFDASGFNASCRALGPRASSLE